VPTPRPPTRDRSLPVDPWAEQAARRDASERRHRWWRVGGAVALAFVLVAVVAWFARREDPGSTADDTVVAVPSAPPVSNTALPGSDATRASDPDPEPNRDVVAPDLQVLVELAEVWLLEHADGTFGWGAVVVSRAPEGGRPLTIEARLLDESGEEVATMDEQVRSLAAGASAVVGGVVADLDGVPQRVEIDVMVGDPPAEPTPSPDDLRIVAVERRGEGDADERADAVVGRLRSTRSSELAGVRLALVWRDDHNEVIGAVFYDIERVRPGVDARFEVPIDDRLRVSGPPTEVHWTH
jgi:hypothetical protein